MNSKRWKRYSGDIQISIDQKKKKNKKERIWKQVHKKQYSIEIKQPLTSPKTECILTDTLKELVL